MSIILNLLLSGFTVFVAAYLIPGVDVDSFVTAIIVALVLGILNSVVKPILEILALPITILTLGLFSLVLNVLMIMLADGLIDGFAVNGFLNALLFGLALAVISWFLGRVGVEK